MFYVYILYSEFIDSYYVGETEDIDNRIKQHKLGFYESDFTKRANDWILFFILECNSRTQSRKIETHIKKMKSRKYFQNLKKYPEITLKLKNEYSN